MRTSLATKTALWMFAMLGGMVLALRSERATAEEHRLATTRGARPAWPARPRPPPRSDGFAASPLCPAHLAGDPRDLVERHAGDPRVYVTRAFVDRALEDQAELMHGGRVVPERRDGATIGVRVFGIRSESTLARLGFENGDLLLRVNGYDMSSPEGALEAYARLRRAAELDVEIVRRGQWMVVRYVLC